MMRNKLVSLITGLLILVPLAALAQTQTVQQQIQALLQQIAALQQQIAQLQGQRGGAQRWCHTFNTNLKIGDRGLEVSNLQTALVRDAAFNKDIGASETVGDMGEGVASFGEYTASAVTGFQEKYRDEILTPSGLKYGTGYVGKVTRAKLNQLYGCGTTTQTGSLYIQPSSANLKVGESVLVKAYYQPPMPQCLAGMRCAQVMPSPQEVNATFTSSDSLIAAIRIAFECAKPPPGVPPACGTYVYGVSPGTATITATYTNEQGTFIATMAVMVGGGLSSICNDSNLYEITSSNSIYESRTRKPASYIVPGGSLTLGIKNLTNGGNDYSGTYRFVSSKPDKVAINGNVARDMITQYNDYDLFIDVSIPDLAACKNVTQPMRVMVGDPFLGTNIAFVYPKSIVPAQVLPPGQPWATISVGEMMSQFDFVRMTDLAYSLEKKLFGIPAFANDAVLFGLMPSWCGGSGQPTGFGVGCLIQPTNEPHWGVVWHEMGHDFTAHFLVEFIDGIGGNYPSHRNLFANWSDSANRTPQEGIPTLAALYSEYHLTQQGNPYGLPKAITDSISKQFTTDTTNSSHDLVAYENTGNSFANMNPGVLDGIFVRLAQGYGWEIYPKAFKIYLDPLPGFITSPLTESQGHTYFVAGLSAAAGVDLRPKFKIWGFPIDDAYYDKIYATVASIVNGAGASSAGTLSIQPSSAQLTVGQSVDIKAYYQPPVPLCSTLPTPCQMAYPAPQQVAAKFVSSDESVAVIRGYAMGCPAPICSGAINTKVLGISPGAATITASYTNGADTFKAKMGVTVGVNASETIIRKVGEQESSFLIQKINTDSVDGLWYQSYPVATGRGSAKILHIGDDIGYACEGVSEKLTSIDFPGQKVIFTKIVGQVPYGGCPKCLAGNTLIDTPSGLVSVKDIRVGMPVWTIEKDGHRVSEIVTKISKVPVPSTHQMVHLVLDDGRELFASPGHPTIDGRTVGDLVTNDFYDGVRVVASGRVGYGDGATYDILPSGETGFYRANGIPLDSTLH